MFLRTPFSHATKFPSPLPPFFSDFPPQFNAFCEALGSALQAEAAASDQGDETERCWFDYIDPCSGFPVYSPRGASAYAEVPAAEMLLGFEVMQTGCCGVLSHPAWGPAVYPSSFFTTAPFEAVVAALATVSEGDRGGEIPIAGVDTHDDGGE